ncbi:MAG: OsmC family protein [Candidatus Omnitrophota bacterium]|jgi:uncharacterized OsmC-like protein
MAIRVEIVAEEKEKFLANFSSGTRIYVDLSKEEASGPNPLEVFLASVASCVCVYAKKYLTQHSIEFKELRVEATAELSKDPPTRLVDIRIKTHTDAKLNSAEKEVFLRFMKNCPIHNTVIHTKSIEIDLI